MTVKVAINGFGRIGRLVLRAALEQGRDDIEVIAINDLGPVEMNAHLLEFDSVHGRFPHAVSFGEDWIDAGRGKIKVTAIRNPDDLPWADVDIVMECTGIFKGDKALVHLGNGSSRVLVSAPSSGADKTIVYGVNHGELTANDVHVSNASCTTNCLAPVVKVIHEKLGIKHVMVHEHNKGYGGNQKTCYNKARHWHHVYHGFGVYNMQTLCVGMVTRATISSRSNKVSINSFKNCNYGIVVSRYI